MDGPRIITQTLSQPDNVTDSYGNNWQYHSRSDRHSKAACWAFLFDLLRHCALLRKHVTQGLVGFGINHKMIDFSQNKKKDLDLVICRTDPKESTSTRSFLTLADEFRIALTAEQRRMLSEFPLLRIAPVGNVLIAVEAKAAMTSHIKACPQLYDELNSSHSIIHGDSQVAIAVGLVLINYAERFISPDSNKFGLAGHDAKVSLHKQPHATERTIATITQLDRRSSTNSPGFDGVAALVIDCGNDGRPVTLVTAPPAPSKDHVLNYDALVNRIDHLYRSRFPQA